MLGRRKQTSIRINTKDVSKVALAEFLKYYEQPISEEQAWAICFQCCCKMKQMLDEGLDSTLQMIILDVNNLYIHSDGSISFTIQHDFDSHSKLQPSSVLEDKLIEQLGKVIYEALDWGIESDMERELSESLEMLISFMLKLDIETTKAAVSFQNVIKICEDHFLKPSEAASHYILICKVLFAEYIELQNLLLTIQSCEEYLKRMDMEDCSVNQKADDSAALWQDVLGDLQRGTKLHQVMQQSQHKSFPEENTRSSYSTVMDDIKNKRYSLRKATKRKLRERICQEPSLHERLMMEVKNPPKLKPISRERTKSHYKENCQRLSMDPSINSVFANQIMSTTDSSKPKKPRLSCIQSDSELKALSHNPHKSSKQSLPAIADLMGTKYFEHVSEIKDFCRKDSFTSRAQVCLICHNQFFIWPYMCHFCSRVICKNCCIKMSMPVRSCARLPLDFFKVVKLGKEKNPEMQSHKTTQLLCKAEHWDSLKIPLVFEPHSTPSPLVCHIESMIDWPSMDICVKCEQHLLDILSHQPLCRKRPLPWSDLE